MRRRWRGGLVAALGLVLFAAGALPAAAAGPVSVWLEGRQLALDPAPLIIDDRTLIPLRGVFEALGATVNWDDATRSVTATRPGRYVRLRIGLRMACLSAACDQADLMDVPGRIIDGRTFVPLRFVATAMGAGVDWDPARRAVLLTAAGGPPAARTVTLASVQPNQVLTGPVTLQSQAAVPAAQVRYFLLDPATGQGPLIAMSPDPAAPQGWRPDPAYAGSRLLAAAAYAADGRLVGSHLVPVTLQPDPKVTMSGPAPGQTVTGPLAMSVDLGFVATHVKYTRTDPVSGAAATLAEADPYAPFTWYPGVADNGTWQISATAYDRTGRAYPAQPVTVNVQIAPTTSLAGVKDGQTLNGPVSLRAAANYPVQRVQFLLSDGTVLQDGAATSFRWFPGPEKNGTHTISTVVWGQDGAVRVANPVQVIVSAAPALRMTGVGPKQVLTGKVTLKGEANVPFASVEFRLLNPDTRAIHKVVAGGSNANAAYDWTPDQSLEGNWLLQGAARTAAGQQVLTDAIPVRVFTGTVYGPKPVVPQNQFIGLASGLALPAQQKTGMSAALQVAQAILETGWGQYMPVDKYTGQVSYNLFGIKGQGPAGSIISHTWEEYGGVAYRVDDYFRAYRSVEQSWQDHKDFLINRERYAQFRAVMTDPVLGAWALRRAGYATDSRYPFKLIDIMNRNNLFALDEMEP